MFSAARLMWGGGETKLTANGCDHKVMKHERTWSQILLNVSLVLTNIHIGLISIDLFTERKACWENGGDLEISTPRSFEFRQVVRSLFSKQTSLPKHEE